MNKVVTLGSWDRDEIEWPDRGADAFLEWWRRKLAEVPEGYRDTVEVSLENDGYEGLPSIEVTYARPETEDETLRRVEEERSYARRREEADRQRYEELRKRFEPS